MESKIISISQIPGGWQVLLKGGKTVELNHSDVLLLADRFYGAKELD